jgi:hypothetical protein
MTKWKIYNEDVLEWAKNYRKEKFSALLLPPKEYAPRRILVPFSGVASEMVGCGLAGWEQIVGVEFDTENGYIDIAERRLDHWLRKK